MNNATGRGEPSSRDQDCAARASGTALSVNGGYEKNIASLLDEVCSLFAEAEDRGEVPEYLLVAESVCRQLREVKAFERRIDAPLVVLGLLVKCRPNA